MRGLTTRGGSVASLIARIGTIVALAIGLGACLEPGDVCGDGRCPPGTVCDLAHVRCIYPEQLVGCAGILDGTLCPIGGQLVGICEGGVCLRAYCGDGLAVAPEQCDGADLAGKTCGALDAGYHGDGHLGCRADCTFDVSACGERCGDGVRNGDEACDRADLGGATCATEGFYGGPLGCTGGCQLDVTACLGRCGDGLRTAGEACDRTDFGARSCNTEGFYGGTLGCNDTCTDVDVSQCAGRCGDGIKNGAEICDGPALGGLDCETYGWYAGALACNADCVSIDTSRCAAYCGDGAVNGNELCDGLDQRGESCQSLGALGGTLSCNGHCQPNRDRCLWGRLRPWSADRPAELFAVWGSGPRDFWAVGLAGAVRHFDGSFLWKSIDLGVGADINLWGVAGTAADDVWVTGDAGTLAHFDGHAWRLRPSGTTRSLGALWTDGVELWVVADYRYLRHWDGAAWTEYDGGGARSVWGSGPDDVWAVGIGGVRRHWDGHAWTALDDTGNHARVWGTGRDDVWIAGFRGDVQHFDGHAWTPVDVFVDDFLFGWSHGRHDVWIGGLSGILMHFDGVRWTRINDVTHGAPYAGFGVGPGDIWIVGTPGILRLDGTGWRRLDAPTDVTLVSVWSQSAEDAWVGGEAGTLIHWDGLAWSTAPPLTGDQINAVWGSAGDDVWAIGSAGAVLHYDGRTWTSIDLGTTGWLSDVWGSDRHDVWIAGTGVLLHYDGIAWRAVPPGEQPWGDLADLQGNAADDVWLGESDGIAFHFDGRAWQRVDSGADNLVSLWSTGPRDLYAMGWDQSVHFDGNTWERLEPAWPREVWGAGRSDLWSSGQIDTVQHFDGTTWTEVNLGARAGQQRFGGSGPDDVWAVADHGAVLHLDHHLPVPFGGVCDQPVSIYCDTTVYGTTRGGPRNLPGYACGERDKPGPEASHLLEVPINGQLTIHMTPHGGDLDLAVLGAGVDRTCAPDQCAGISERDGADVGEELVLEVHQGDRLYLEVDGPGDQPASFTLSVACLKR